MPQGKSLGKYKSGVVLSSDGENAKKLLREMYFSTAYNGKQRLFDTDEKAREALRAARYMDWLEDQKK